MKFFTFFFFISLSAFAQHSLKRMESELKAENVLKKYQHHDFSSFMIPQERFLGFIGNGYQRLKIVFTSVKKQGQQYILTGTSEVKGNKCDFTGTIKVYSIRERQQLRLGLDNTTNVEGHKAQGTLFGVYEFKENPKQKHAGVFTGKMGLNWYVDKNGKMHYDDIESSYSDNFVNNQYEGQWTSYDKKLVKTANWGEHRIPNSGDLDIGAGEFGVNPKYKASGWELLVD